MPLELLRQISNSMSNDVSFLLDITVTNFVVLSMIIIVAILLLFQIHYSDQLLMIWICKDEEETGLVHYIRKFWKISSTSIIQNLPSYTSLEAGDIL